MKCYSYMYNDCKWEVDHAVLLILSDVVIFISASLSISIASGVVVVQNIRLDYLSVGLLHVFW